MHLFDTSLFTQSGCKNNEYVANFTVFGSWANFVFSCMKFIYNICPCRYFISRELLLVLLYTVTILSVRIKQKLAIDNTDIIISYLASIIQLYKTRVCDLSFLNNTKKNDIYFTSAPTHTHKFGMHFFEHAPGLW